MGQRVPFLRFGFPGLVAVLLCSCHGGGNGSPATAPLPTFALSVSPAALSIPSGGGGFAVVTIVRSGGFSDTVTLSLDGAPAGVIGSGTVAAAAQTAQLSLFVAREVSPQTIDLLRVKGTSGNLTQTGEFKLVVAPALPVGQISPDQVQAAGKLQRGGAIENTCLTFEPVTASNAKDSSGAVEVRHGFRPSASAH